MTLARVAQDVWAVFVVLSLAVIGLLAVAGAVLSALTVANARRRARMRSRHVRALARWCPVSELAELDEDLDRVWISDRGKIPGRRVG